MPSSDRAPRDPAPAVQADRLGLMRRVAATMFIIGGCTAALGVEITARTSTARLTQAGCAAAFVLCGVLVVVAPPRRRVIDVSLFAAIGVLGILIAGSNPTGMAPFFYLWPMVYAAYFCSRRVTITCMLWSAVTLGVALAVNRHHELKLDTFIGTVSSVGLMTALVTVMTEREASLRDELAELARTDSLTGLLSRRAFDHELAAMIEHAMRHDDRLAVVMFDLDHFKRFNDVHGHLAGDQALRAMAEVLRQHATPGDALGRFGGEEFIVALADADGDAARRYVDHVARRLAEVDRGPIQDLSTSAGISVFPAAETPGDLVARADQALYAAKAAGRARSAWFDAGELRVGARFAPA